MADNKDNEKIVEQKEGEYSHRIPDFTNSRVVKKQISILAKLGIWQEQSAKTKWVPGEYMEK